MYYCNNNIFFALFDIHNLESPTGSLHPSITIEVRSVDFTAVVKSQSH